MTSNALPYLWLSPNSPESGDINSVIDYYVQMFRVLGSPRYPTPEAELRRRVTESVRRNVCVSGTARQIMAVASSGDQVALLRTIRVPTLVIHGNDDPLVPLACGRDTAHLVRGATLQVIEGMGHDFPVLDKARALESRYADLAETATEKLKEMRG